MSKPTQKDRILGKLYANRAVCGTQLLEAMMPRYAARILELRDEGWRIDTRTCENPSHSHESQQVEYLLRQEG